MNKKSECVDVDEEFAAKLIVPTFQGYNKFGFQRKLNMSRIPDISKSLSNGIISPPIIISVVDGVYYVMDGQHRLEAWKKTKFPLKAMLYKMTKEEAAKNFIALNGKATRVSLGHRLRVDPSEWATLVRDLSIKYKISVGAAHACTIGLIGDNEYYDGTYKMDGLEQKAKKFLDVWTKSRKWDRNLGVFGTNSVIKCVCSVVKASKDIEATLKEILDMDFSKGGPLGRYVGLSFNSQREMKDIIYRHLAKKVI